MSEVTEPIGHDKVPLAGDLPAGDFYDELVECEVYMSAFWIFHHRTGMKFGVDPTLSKEQQESKMDPGYFDIGPIESFHAVLNWTSSWQGKIPPRHIGVKYLDDPIGFLSPFAEYRICWHCQLKGFYAPGKARVRPDWPCPNCKQFDWLGQEQGPNYKVGGKPIISKWDFYQSCENTLAPIIGEEPKNVGQPLWRSRDDLVVG